ncbi:MAG: hypothetical protein Q9186_006361 [Xanthomendoza sp. 1 TL-2023]
MRLNAVFVALNALVSFVTAILATNRIPTAITEAAARPENDSTNALVPSNPVPFRWNTQLPVPNTRTVLYLARGPKMDITSLGILLRRAQLDLIVLITDHGPEGIPHTKGFDVPRYSFWTTTPIGRKCFLFVNAFKGQTLNYRLVNETLAGIKIFVLEQRHDEQMAFLVEHEGKFSAYGGLGFGNKDKELIMTMTDNRSLIKYVLP